MIKTIAMYLPQFHRTPENDEWWGEGYTEWTAVKAAKPLFEGHQQPRVPEAGNYYNLLDKSTMEHQAELMHKYGIDGMAFYHYYFKNGKMVLNKPAENLLKWKDIDMPFCFDWANDSWVRTWSNISGNSWSELFEKKDNEGRAILLEQKYGREREWEEHYRYLSRFFFDSRYIKIGERPVFLIHYPSKIPCLYPMIQYWKRLAENEKKPPIYLIVVNENVVVAGSDATLSLEPRKVDFIDGYTSFDCDDLWDRICRETHYPDQRKYLSAVVDYDTTPRRGKNGCYERGFSVQKFKRGMEELYKKSISWGNEFVFINAWNEWAEGMYLEPDELYGTTCLEAVKEAQIVASGCEGMPDADVVVSDEAERKIDHWNKNMRCLDRWLRLKEENKNIAQSLLKYGIKSVSIYGYGILGRHLLTELSETEIKVDCIIDRLTEYPNLDIPVYSIDTIPKGKRTIVVTALGDFETIFDVLTEKINDCQIFSVYELISELL